MVSLCQVPPAYIFFFNFRCSLWGRSGLSWSQQAFSETCQCQALLQALGFSVNRPGQVPSPQGIIHSSGRPSSYSWNPSLWLFNDPPWSSWSYVQVVGTQLITHSNSFLTYSINVTRKNQRYLTSLGCFFLVRLRIKWNDLCEKI